MTAALALFGVVSLAVLILTLCSRYLIRVAVRLLTRQSDRLEAHRVASRAYRDEFTRALRHHREYARLESRVMGE